VVEPNQGKSKFSLGTSHSDGNGRSADQVLQSRVALPFDHALVNTPGLFSVQIPFGLPGCSKKMSCQSLASS